MERLVRFLKDWTLPVAITVGITAYLCFTRINTLQAAGSRLGEIIDVVFPFTVFLTLWATFCKVDFKALRPARWVFPVTLVQITATGVCIAVTAMTDGNGRLIGMGCLACLIAPCATAAPIVTSKLGGSLNKMTAHVLISSLLAAVTIPLAATLLTSENGASGNFAAIIGNGLHILRRVSTVLVLPLFLGWLVRRWLHPVHRWVVRHSNLPFYLWCVALSITSGVTIRGIDHTGLPFPILLIMALSALIICLLQFWIGRMIGARSRRLDGKEGKDARQKCGSRIEGGQALGQKNTALIIWATSVFLHPAAALAPGCYVLWQNIVNSLQLHHAQRKTD